MAKASKALAERRVNDLLSIVLDGAQGWDVFQYVREKEKEEGSAWFIEKDATPLTDGMIRKYLTRAYRAMESDYEKSRKRLLRRHIAQLRNLFAKAATTGELNTARAILRDIAELLRLLPRPEDELKKQLDEMRETLKGFINGDGKTQEGDRGVARADQPPR